MSNNNEKLGKLMKLFIGLQNLNAEIFETLESMNADDAARVFDQNSCESETMLSEIIDQLIGGTEPEDLDCEVIDRSY